MNVYKAEIRARLCQPKGILLTEFKRGCDAPSGFSQGEQSHKDLTTSTVVKKLNPIDPPTTDKLARFAVDEHNIKF